MIKNYFEHKKVNVFFKKKNVHIGVFLFKKMVYTGTYMGSIIAKLLFTALAFFAAAYLVPGIEVLSFYTALILAVLWGIVNLLFKPILVLLTLPINFLTLGLFTLVINGFLFWFLGTFVRGFSVDGFLVAIIGAAVVVVVNWLGDLLIREIGS